MALLTIIRIFSLTIIFNMILPSGDVYTDIALMIQTWTFKNIESIELSGCRACYGKDEQDLVPSQKDCTTCITKNDLFWCGRSVSSLKKLMDIENNNQCENKKWGVNSKGILEEGECDDNHRCCFETNNNHLNIKSKGEDIIYNNKTSLGCGADVCKIHLDAANHWVSGINDLKSWNSKIVYYYGIRYGGKDCRLLRIYSWSMAIPILINLLFSSVIFYIDLKSGVSTKYEVPFLIMLFYPQWRTLKILVKYFFHKSDEELTKQLDENDKQVSFIEPFCESGLQVLTTLCVVFTTEAFYHKNSYGNSETSMTFAVYTLILSLFTGSFGITKFFLKGPLPILPLDAPLAGVLSLKFLVLLLLNTMFVVRTFCVEASFFTSYRYSKINVDPLIPEEYRLVIYLLPALLSFIINLIRLACTMRLKDFQYFKNYPQFILCPMFSPLMFEENPENRNDNEPLVRVWKLGSIVNSVSIGCLPQILLIAMEQYRQVPTWYQKAEENSGYYSDSNALIKHPFGNTIFAIASFLLYLFLTIIFFSWNKLSRKDGCLCKLCKSICPPCPSPCNKQQSEESDPSIVDNPDDPKNGFELSIRDASSAETSQDTEGERAKVEAMNNQYQRNRNWRSTKS